MKVAVRVVYFQPSCDCRFHFLSCLLRRQRAVERHTVISVRYLCVGRCKIRVQIDRLFEVRDGYLIIASIAPEEAALQVKLIGFRVIGLALRESLLLIAGQLQAQPVRDLLRDLALELKHVAQLPVVLSAPKPPVVLHIDKLSTDQEIIAMLSKPASEHSPDFQFVADDLWVGLLSLVTQN